MDHPIFAFLCDSSETPEQPDCEWLPITAAVVREGSWGTFIKLYLHREETGEDIEATCDSQYFDLLQPYLEAYHLWVQAGKRDEPPVVPVFFGDKTGKWKFSDKAARAHTAEIESLEFTPIESFAPETEDLAAFRLQVTITKGLARRFAHAAELRGMTQSEYLIQLVRANSFQNGLTARPRAH